MVARFDQLSLDDLWAYVAELLGALVADALPGEGADEEFARARSALECLPLNTEEFATANNRLANARSYFRAGECGAARYELRLLLLSLNPYAWR